MRHECVPLSPARTPFRTGTRPARSEEVARVPDGAIARTLLHFTSILFEADAAISYNIKFI